jgi:hypothetical protein
VLVLLLLLPPVGLQQHAHGVLCTLLAAQQRINRACKQQQETGKSDSAKKFISCKPDGVEAW